MLKYLIVLDSGGSVFFFMTVTGDGGCLREYSVGSVMKKEVFPSVVSL